MINPNFDWFGLYHAPDHLEIIKSLRDLTPKDGIIVEIGSFVGGSTQAMVGDQRKVYCVDPWHWDSPDYGGEKDKTMAQIRGMGPSSGSGRRFFKTFCRNMNTELFKHVFPIRAYSDEAGDIFPFPVDMIFFDGEHTGKAFEAEFKAWRHLIKPSTILAMDDYGDYFTCLRDKINEIIGKDNLDSFHPLSKKHGKPMGIVHVKAEKVWDRIQKFK